MVLVGAPGEPGLDPSGLQRRFPGVGVVGGVGPDHLLIAQDQLIGSEQDRVQLVRDTVTRQMAQADSLIASMEQQVTFMTNLIAAMRPGA